MRKTVIVTGGTYGIGRAIVLALARDWNVLAFGLEAAQPGSLAAGGIADTSAALTAAGLRAELMEADVSVEVDAAQVVARAVACFGRIDALVNNAAVRPVGTIGQTSLSDWHKALAVNLTGPFLMCRAVLPYFATSGGGSIVNIGSGAGWGKRGIAAYSASKGGLHALTRAMALDHLDDGIRVNLVVPAPATPSGMVEAIDAARAKPVSPSAAPDPQAVANTVRFLLSDDARGVTGTTVEIDGTAR